MWNNNPSGWRNYDEDAYAYEESGTTTTPGPTTLRPQPIGFRITNWESYFTNMTIDGDLVLIG